MKPLFEKTRIKTLEMENRFVRSATWMAMAAPGGACTEAVLDCYNTLAEGRIGLIISGFAFVSREGQGPVGQLGIYSDELVDGLRMLTRGVHDRRGRIAAQIVHCGNQSKPENNGGLEVIGPSDVEEGDEQAPARTMTLKEIARVADDFGAAAERAKAAGFDAIQLHYAHGYLGSQFLSPHHNQREDEYGGSIDNRSRFLYDVYRKARQAVGEDYPILAKMNLEDFLDDGLIAKDGLRVAAQLENLGLDGLEVSGGMRASGNLGPARKKKDGFGEAYFLENARAVKQDLKMTTFLVGGLRTPARMEAIHRETGIDYFSMSRPFIQEPHLVKRWQNDDTVPAACVSCSGCFMSIKKGRGVFCVKTRKKK